MKLAKTVFLGLMARSCSTAQMTSAAAVINYKNQRGSTLTLILQQGEQENTGTVRGTFTTAVGNCKTDVGVPLPIAGFYDGNAVTYLKPFNGHKIFQRHALGKLCGVFCGRLPVMS